MKQATGSIERWLEYLENHDISGSTKHHSFNVDRGPSPQLDEEELDINISLVYDCDLLNYYAELTWEYDGIGEEPNDIVAMFYDKSWWKLAYDNLSETTSTSYYVDPEEEWGFDFEGPAYEVRDAAASWHAPDDYQWAGVYLEPREDDVDPEDREIQGEYQHFWSDVTYSDVAVSFPRGISVSVEDEERTWVTGSEQGTDDLLRMSEDEADLKNCGGIQ